MKQNIEEQVRQYLSNAMTAEERREFEEDCANDIEFREQVKNEIAATYAIRKYANEQRKQRFDEYHSAWKRKQKIWRWIMISVVTAILFFAVGFYFWKQRKEELKNDIPYVEDTRQDDSFDGRSNSEKLSLLAINEIRKNPYRSNRDTRSEGYEDILKEAKNQYEKQQFQKAINSFQKIQTATKDSIQIQLYLATSYIAISESEKAIDLLLPLTEIPDTNEQAEAQYYLALAYLESGDFDNAENTFDSILEIPNQAVQNFYLSKVKALKDNMLKIKALPPPPNEKIKE